MDTTNLTANFWQVLLALFFVLGCITAGIIAKKIENRRRAAAAAAPAAVRRNFDFFQY